MIAKNNTTKINQHVFREGTITDNGTCATISFNETNIFDTYNDISIEKMYGSNNILIFTFYSVKIAKILFSMSIF